MPEREEEHVPLIAFGRSRLCAMGSTAVDSFKKSNRGASRVGVVKEPAQKNNVQRIHILQNQENSP
jgi:hypothetical protein